MLAERQITFFAKGQKVRVVVDLVRSQPSIRAVFHREEVADVEDYRVTAPPAHKATESVTFADPRLRPGVQLIASRLR